VNVAKSSDIEKVIVGNCDCLAMIINRLKICEPVKFMSHVLNGIKVCKPKGICIEGGRILRGGDNTIRFTGDRTKFDATDRHMRMIIFALK
jgi:hypothetical protein